MEKTGSNLIKIDQHDVKIMLQDRILNPKDYIDKPILLWRGNFDDGILWGVSFRFDPHVRTLIKNGGDDVACPKWVQLKLDSLNASGFSLPERDSNRTFYYIFSLPDQNLATPPTYEEYSDFINTDWLIRVQERTKSPIVVFLPFIEQPDAFKGYSQYVFTPDYNQWKETQAGCKRQLIKCLVGFLDSSVSEEERNYRWFQYFQRQKAGMDGSDLNCQFRGSGCDFPSCWDDGIDSLIRRYHLPMSQIPKGYIPRKPVKVSEISASEFKAFFNKGISEDVIKDFRTYLVEHKAEI